MSSLSALSKKAEFLSGLPSSGLSSSAAYPAQPYRLIVAEPRSCSTAFTRALCYASKKAGIHENLIGKVEVETDSSVRPLIYKEMLTNSEEPSLKIYDIKLRILLKNAEKPVILITANPFEILLSILKLKLSVFKPTNPHGIKERLLIEKFNEALKETELNVNKLTDIEIFTGEHNIPLLRLTKNEILSTPHGSVNKALRAWKEPPLSFGIEKPVPLVKTVPYVEDDEELAFEERKYHFTYPDPWTSEQDRNMRILEKSERNENDATQSVICEQKVADLLREKTEQYVESPEQRKILQDIFQSMMKLFHNNLKENKESAR